MPISFDTSTEEITKALISTYENKLRNMCTLNVEVIYELISSINQNYRYLYINVSNCDYLNGTATDLVFDLKYNVPIIEAKTVPSESLLIYTLEESAKIWDEQRRILIKLNDGTDTCYYIECVYLKENELFKSVALNWRYNPDMVKTYKRYIELRGE